MATATTNGTTSKASSAKNAGEDTLAVIDLGEFSVAVPVTQVREVVPCPAEFDPLPSIEQGVLGCFALRSQIVPVLDLPRFLELSAGTEASKRSVVVILTHEKMLLGIVAQSAVKLVKRADCDAHEMRHNNGAKPSRIVGKMATDKEMVFPLLDIKELYSESVPLVKDTREAKRNLDHSDRFLLFETDGVQMCLPITQIETTIPSSEVNGWSARSDICCGTIKSHWYELALLDPLALLGLSSGSSDTKRTSAVVVRLKDGDRFAIRVDRVVDIIRISETDLGAVPDTIYACPHLIQGVVSRDDQVNFIVLHYAAMLEESRITELGKVVIKNTNAEDKAANSGRQMQCLLLDAEKPCAIDLDQVVEIIPWREDIGGPGSDGFVRSISNRNEMLPIYCLASIFGLQPGTFTKRSAVIVVRRNGKRVGLLIKELIAVEMLALYQQNSTVMTAMARRLTRSTVNLFEMVDTETLPLTASSAAMSA